MKSLTAKVSRPVAPVNPTKANPIMATQAVTSPIVKAPMIRKTLSLMVQEKDNWVIHNDRDK